jgi:hypothetical protein
MFTDVLNISNIEDRSYGRWLSFIIYKDYCGPRYIYIYTCSYYSYENALVYKRPFQSVFMNKCVCVYISFSL